MSREVIVYGLGPECEWVKIADVDFGDVLVGHLSSDRAKQALASALNLYAPTFMVTDGSHRWRLTVRANLVPARENDNE